MSQVSRDPGNHLAGSTSPYLLLHADNPVAWYPWDAEALARARREDRPIFLSIGYSACHWCHVMARESFEDAETARYLNRHFVSIKVDREQRPDLDALYMSAVQALTGSGGWPMSVFLTPDLKPFYAGTYFPKEGRPGLPSFRRVLEAVVDAYENRRGDIEQTAARVTEVIRRSARNGGAGEAALDADLLTAAVARLGRRFDAAHGGFSGAPKFPPATALCLLLTCHRRTRDEEALAMVRTTLDAMARGGVYDQLGGGFHRYAVDEQWLVPHFEKMLYDNALLAAAYLEAHQATGEPLYERVARDTLDWMLREMTDPGGGFHSALSAETGGEEGAFYVWTPDQIRGVLGPEDGDLVCRYFGVTEEGNFEQGKSVLRVPVLPEKLAEREGLTVEALRRRLDDARQALLAARAKREPPAKDDKVLADWNALAVSALALAGRVLDEPRYREAAERAARFVLGEMCAGETVLLHAHRRGTSGVPAMLDDYAYLAAALVDLYEATGEASCLDRARRLADAMIDRFEDAEGGGFFETQAGQEDLIARLKRGYDQARPSGNAVAARTLLRLAALVDEEGYRQKAVATLRAFCSTMVDVPEAAAGLLLALDLHLGRAS